jgi:hypothetical protein
MVVTEPPELAELQRLIDDGGVEMHARVLCEVQCQGRRFPVHAFSLGNPAPEVPAVGFFGGVHGLERVGADVVMAYMRSLLMRLPWDEVLQQQLQGVRLVFMPLVNPAGLWLGTRANANGVDLMRNSPVEASEPVPFMLGGQRISSGMPWYRGRRGGPMEAESQALCELVEQELLSRSFSLAVDCHSGFGSEDRIWFPYAHTVKPIEHLPEMHALRRIFEQSHAHHRYVFEPQSRQYLTHGDLWDHLYLNACRDRGRVFLPLTLEMGSWLWIKKNPRQIFSRIGIFNPLIQHRLHRVMRRHIALLDFFTRAASSYEKWLPKGNARTRCRSEALTAWYGEAKAR